MDLEDINRFRLKLTLPPDFSNISNSIFLMDTNSMQEKMKFTFYQQCKMISCNIFSIKRINEIKIILFEVELRSYKD